MVVLECGLRASVQEVYNFKSKKFEEKTLDSLLLSFQEVYPNQPLLASVLRGCLQVSEKNRSTSEKVLQSLVMEMDLGGDDIIDIKEYKSQRGHHEFDFEPQLPENFVYVKRPSL